MTYREAQIKNERERGDWTLLADSERVRERERARDSERERQRERPLVPQRDRLSHGLSVGSLPERGTADRRLPIHTPGEKHRRKKEGEE